MAVTTKKYTIERRVGNLYSKGQVVDLDLETAIYYSSIGYVRLSNAEIADYTAKLNDEIDKSIDEDTPNGDVKPSYTPALNADEIREDVLKEVTGSFVSKEDMDLAMQKLQDNLLANLKNESPVSSSKTLVV